MRSQFAACRVQPLRSPSNVNKSIITWTKELHNLKSIQITKSTQGASGAAADTKMANTGGRSHQRVSFPPVQEQTKDELSNCALCSGCYTSLYEPQAWRNEQAQQIAKSLCVWPDKCICHVCKDNTSRPVKNPSHTPRWGENVVWSAACQDVMLPHLRSPNHLYGYRLRLDFAFLVELVKPPAWDISISMLSLFPTQIQSTRHTCWCRYRRK